MTAVQAAAGCPFCRAVPDRTTSPVERPAVLRHRDGCAVAADVDRQATADAAALAAAPAGIELTRALSSGERIAFGAARGMPPIPARVAAAVEVRVLALAPALLLQAMLFRGELRSLAVVSVPGEIG